MRQRWNLLVAILVILPGACGKPVETTADVTWVYGVLPAGDAQQGRDVFDKFACHACHAVAGDPEFPAPVSAHPGPELGPMLDTRSQGSLVSSIVAPSHSVVNEDEFSEQGLSYMGDFTDVMTVRELVDLVAYIRRVAEGGG